MAGLKHDDDRTPDAELDLRTSPGDEPVWTFEALSDIEGVVPESARSEEAPRVEGLDLRDSPGDEPVHPHGDPVERWVDYLLAAQVMLMRRDDAHVAPAAPLTFGDWVADGHETGPPTLDDLAYHLTTLFPPVRPRGWLELRMCDALPTPFWQVAVAVTAALVREPGAAPQLERTLAATTDLWVDAAQLGLGHPTLRSAATEVFELAVALLDEADDPHADLASLYLDRWVARGRCPADDRLDQWRRDGTLFPPSESPVPYGVDALAAATGPRR